jgi:hypothetical protein
MGVLCYLLHLVLPGVVAAPHLPHSPHLTHAEKRGRNDIAIHEEDKKILE